MSTQPSAEEYGNVVHLPVTRPAGEVEQPIEPTRVWAPQRTVDLVVRRVETLRHSNHHRGLLRRAARATGTSVKYGGIGLGRTAATYWTWVTAIEHAAKASSETVETVRKRRRITSLWVAGGGVVGDAVLANAYGLPLWAAPIALLAAAAGISGVAVYARQAKPGESHAEGQSIGRHPGSKAVRRLVAGAGQLGKFEEIRILAPGVVRSDNSWSALVELPGIPAAKAVGKRLELAANAGVGLAQIDVDPVKGHAARFELWVADSDPLAGESLPSPLITRAEPFNAWREKIPVGLDVRGRPVAFSLPERSLLVGGEPGGGKSVACNNYLGAVSLDPFVRLRLVDGKGGADLSDYERIAEEFLGEPDCPAVLEMLTDTQDEMSDRYRRLKAIGARKVTADLAEELNMRLIVVHLDEIQVFSTDADYGKAIVKALWDLVSRGRASGIIVSAATQRPAVEVVPSRLRDILSIRWALRCTTPQASDTVLGQGQAGRGFNAATIDSTQRGAGLLLAEGSLPTYLRSNYISDAELQAITRRAYRFREEAGTLPVRENDPGVLLLGACVVACGDAEKIWTADLLARLATEPAWAHLNGDPGELARLLKPYGIAPKGQDIDGTNRNGYRRGQFVQALDRLHRR